MMCRCLACFVAVVFLAVAPARSMRGELFTLNASADTQNYRLPDTLVFRGLVRITMIAATCTASPTLAKS